MISISFMIMYSSLIDMRSNPRDQPLCPSDKLANMVFCVTDIDLVRQLVAGSVEVPFSAAAAVPLPGTIALQKITVQFPVPSAPSSERPYSPGRIARPALTKA